MKTFFQIIITILAAAGIVLGISISFLGTKETIGSLKIAYIHFIGDKVNSDTTVGNYSADTSANVLGATHMQYSNLIIEDVDQIVTEVEPAPFIVPSSGIAGHKDFLYIPGSHGGIDIWTSSNGWGVDGDRNKGNPVYAACSGMVTRVFEPNEEIEIICDQIDEEYKDIVPSLKVKTLYSHMGSGVSLESFHELYVGKRVSQGDLIGYQGNKSSFVPENRVVHLHFGVYDLTKAGRPTLNPADYIGVPTTIVGQVFVATSF